VILRKVTSGWLETPGEHNGVRMDTSESEGKTQQSVDWILHLKTDQLVSDRQRNKLSAVSAVFSQAAHIP